MLSGVTPRMTDAERAREPRDLGVIAWFDGYTQAAYPRAVPATYPRRLTASEARSWRAGFTEGQDERRRLAAHGFASCASVGCGGWHRP